MEHASLTREEELDMRIAQTLGWTNVGKLAGKRPEGYRDYLPSWSTDLNLMHKLEKALSTSEVHRYVAALIEIVTPGWELSHWCGYYIHATAQQKAEAWLKVMEAHDDADK